MYDSETCVDRCMSYGDKRYECGHFYLNRIAVAHIRSNSSHYFFVVVAYCVQSRRSHPFFRELDGELLPLENVALETVFGCNCRSQRSHVDKRNAFVTKNGDGVHFSKSTKNFPKLLLAQAENGRGWGDV